MRLPQGWWIVGAIASLGLWCACGRDAKLAGKTLRNPTVKSVSLYGLALDQNAPPEQVAFAALRAIREDALAPDAASREAALDKQFDLCAADVLAARNRSSMPRDQFLHGVVYHWTPTVAHYAQGLETEWEKAAARLVKRDTTPSKDAVKECEVVMQTTDPSGDPKASVVLVVWMVQDSGYWRVTHLGFEPARRTLQDS
jgi:hypothetical protein